MSEDSVPQPSDGEPGPIPMATSTDNLIEEKGEEPKMTDEARRLGSRPPLSTIVILSVGPLISQITGSLYGIVNTVWVSKAIGDKGMTAISTYNNFDTIGRSFAYFLQVAASAKISALFGAGKGHEAAQVFSDLLRFSVICTAVAIAGFLPWCKIAARWFGASEEIVELGYEYILPNLCGTFVPCVYLLACGCLQAEGRSWLFTAVQVSALIGNMFIFAPFFLFVLKMGISGVAYSTLVAELIPGLVVVVLFYCGRFGIKPHVRDLLKKPSPHTWVAVKVGFAQLVYQLSLALPGLLIRYYFGYGCKFYDDPEKTFNDVMAGFNTFCRFWSMVVCVPNALTIGFLPAASYANGAKRFSRVIRLLLHAGWMSILWSSAAMIFTVGLPRLVCLVFSSSEGYLEWGEVIVRRANLLQFALPVPIITTALLQALQYGGLASLLTLLCQTMPLPVISTALFYTNKKDVARMMYSYPIAHGYSALVAVPFAAFALRRIWNRSDDVDLNNGEVVLEEITDEKKEPLIEKEREP